MDKSEYVPFLLKYDPALRSISSIVGKHFNILISSFRCHAIFKFAPVVASRRSNNLSNYFCSRKITRPFTKQYTPLSLFSMQQLLLACTYISKGLLLTHSIPPVK